MEEARFDLSKSLVRGKMFAEVIFGLQPDILHWVLLRRIGGKAHTGDFPIRLLPALVFFSQEVGHVLSPMVTGPIPQPEQAFAGVEGLAMADKIDGVLAVASRCGLRVEISRQ